MRKLLIGAGMLAAALGTAAAQAETTPPDRRTFAVTLGLMIGSGNSCGYGVSQDGLEAYLRKVVPDADSAFTASLAFEIVKAGGAMEDARGKAPKEWSDLCRSVRKLGQGLGVIP